MGFWKNLLRYPPLQNPENPFGGGVFLVKRTDIKMATDIARLFTNAQNIMSLISFLRHVRIFFMNFLDHFFNFWLKICIFLKISKITKKVKIDENFSFDAHRWRFSEKTSFFKLSAHNIVKKRSKNLESKGVTLSIFVDFGHFEKLRDFL